MSFDIVNEEEEKGVNELAIELNENVAQVTEKFLDRIVDEQNILEFCWTFTSFQKECNERCSLFKELHSFDPLFLPLKMPLCIDSDCISYQSPSFNFCFVFLWKIELTENGEIIHTKKFLPKIPLKSKIFYFFFIFFLIYYSK